MSLDAVLRRNDAESLGPKAELIERLNVAFPEAEWEDPRLAVESLLHARFEETATAVRRLEKICRISAPDGSVEIVFFAQEDPIHFFTLSLYGRQLPRSILKRLSECFSASVFELEGDVLFSAK